VPDIDSGRPHVPLAAPRPAPARTGPAVFVSGWALEQLWLFWVAPIIGAVIGGLLYRWLAEDTA
jgi:aquaporin Z